MIGPTRSGTTRGTTRATGATEVFGLLADTQAVAAEVVNCFVGPGEWDTVEAASDAKLLRSRAPERSLRIQVPPWRQPRGKS